MRVVRCLDADELRRLAVPFLETREAEHGVLLSLVLDLDSLPASAFAGVIPRGDAIVGVAMRLGQRLLVSNVENDALASFTDLATQPATAVLGPPAAVETVAHAMGRPVTFELRQGIYLNDGVIPPPRRPAGRRRVAHDADLDALVEWRMDLGRVVGDAADLARIRDSTRAHIEHKHLHVWEIDDGRIVSAAAAVGPTTHGIRINNVYTPAELRGRGYASALVADLTQLMLDGGRSFTFLHTDLANPTSNGIYQRIGYRRVGDFLMQRFD